MSQRSFRRQTEDRNCHESHLPLSLQSRLSAHFEAEGGGSWDYQVGYKLPAGKTRGFPRFPKLFQLPACLTELLFPHISRSSSFLTFPGPPLPSYFLELLFPHISWSSFFLIFLPEDTGFFQPLGPKPSLAWELILKPGWLAGDRELLREVGNRRTFAWKILCPLRRGHRPRDSMLSLWGP